MISNQNAPAMLLTVAAHLLLVGSTNAQPAMPKIRIVFMTPADVDVPDGVQDRMDRTADYTEQFLVKWMKAWDYPPARERIFERDANGHAVVHFVKSPDSIANGKFPMKEGNMARKGKLLAMEQHGLPKGTLDIWWVWIYVGDPPAKYSSYLGSGNAAQGGLSQVNYTNLPGTIGLDAELGSKYLKDLTLKGTIHEFGHALGLPHNGPREKRDLGIPLMGATFFNYKRRTKVEEERVFLSEASAAILWKHPVFTNTAEKRYANLNVQWDEISIENDRENRVVHITGRVESAVPPHSVIAYDTAANIQATYFQKPYVARTAADGSFRITIDEPIGVPTSGIIELVACCENGSMSGGGKARGIGSAYEVAYQTSRTGYVLKGR